MSYFYCKIVRTSFEDTVNRVTDLLKNEGFSVITDIDLKEKFKEKLNIDFKKYRILGACNPAFAHKAVVAEEKIGVMLPCNVLVIDKENGMTEVSAVDPVASMMAVKNPALAPLASEIKEKLQKVVESI